MEIFLINPNRKSHYSIGLVSIATYLTKEGLTVRMVTGGPREFTDYLATHRARVQGIPVAGITATTDVFPDAVEIAKIIKAASPSTRIVIGGYHANALPHETLSRYECFDAVVVGEGEHTFLEMVRKIISGQFPTRALGCYEKVNTQIIFNGARPLLKNLSELPMPDFDLLDFDLRKYPTARIRWKAIKSRNGMYMMVSRGCPFSCVFCDSRSIWQRKVRFYDIQDIVADIKDKVEKYGLDTISFLDDELISNPKVISAFCTGMIKNEIHKRIKWECHAHPRSVSMDKLQAMKEAGCVLVRFGFESGSARSLTFLKNNSTRVEDNYTAVALCKKAGIGAFGSFIIGCPEETVDDVIDTVRFILFSGVDSAALFVLVPYPGSAFYDVAVREGLLERGLSWDQFKVEGDNAYPIVRTRLFSRDQLYHMRKYIAESVVKPLNYGFLNTPGKRKACFERTQSALYEISQNNFSVKRYGRRMWDTRIYLQDFQYNVGYKARMVAIDPMRIARRIRRIFSST